MKKGEKLEYLIKEKYPHLSNRKFAELADIAPTTLQGLFSRGIENANIQIVKKIANALEMTVDELDEQMYSSDITIEEKPIPKIRPYIQEIKTINIYERPTKKLSIKTMDYFGDVSAGIPTSIEGIKNAEKLTLPKFFLGKYGNRYDTFAVKVNGESMNKIIPNGSIAICIPVDSIEDLKNEDIVIFTKGNETSMKRLFFTDNAIVFSPESSMRCFYDIVIDKETIDEVVVNAKVISYHAILD